MTSLGVMWRNWYTLAVLAAGHLATTGHGWHRPTGILAAAAFIAATVRYRERLWYDIRHWRHDQWLAKQIEKVQRKRILADNESPVPAPTVRQHRERRREILELDVDLQPGTRPHDFESLRPALAAATRASLHLAASAPGSYRMTFIWRDRLAEPVPFHLPLAVDSTRIRIGDDRFGAPVTADFDGTRTLIAGASGMGKSSTVHAVVATLAVDHTIDLVMLDGKEGVELGGWEWRCLRYADRPDHHLKTLLWLEQERQQRSIATREADTKPPLLVVVVDEAASILREIADKRERQAALGALIALTQKGRSARISLIYSTQNPQAEVLPTDVKANVLQRIGFTCGDRKQSEAIMAVEHARLADHDGWPPGRGVFLDNVVAHHFRACGLYGDQLADVVAAVRAQFSGPIRVDWPAPVTDLPAVTVDDPPAPSRCLSPPVTGTAVAVAEPPSLPPPHPNSLMVPMPLHPQLDPLLRTRDKLLVALRNALPGGKHIDELTAITGTNRKNCARLMRRWEIGEPDARTRRWYLQGHVPTRRPPR